MKKLTGHQLALERARQAYSEAYGNFRNEARDLNESPQHYIPGDAGWRRFLEAALVCEHAWNAWQDLARLDRRPAKSIMGCL